MSLSSTCRVCGKVVSPSEYSASWCNDCDKLGKEGGVAFQKANPTATESDILYAERMARSARAHTAHKNFVDPREFSATRGLIPVPPQHNAQEGGPL